MLRNITIFVLAAVAIAITVYIGVDGIRNNSASGAFFVFIGSAATIGLTIDIVLHIRTRIRRNALRKLGL